MGDWVLGMLGLRVSLAWVLGLAKGSVLLVLLLGAWGEVGLQSGFKRWKGKDMHLMQMDRRVVRKSWG